MSPELRLRLHDWLAPSVVDELPGGYPPGYDGPLDERTPGFFTIPAAARIQADRERLIDEARD